MHLLRGECTHLLPLKEIREKLAVLLLKEVGVAQLEDLLRVAEDIVRADVAMRDLTFFEVAPDADERLQDVPDLVLLEEDLVLHL